MCHGNIQRSTYNNCYHVGDMNGCMASACPTASSPLVPAVAPAASKPSACPPKKTAAASCRRRTVSCRATGSGSRGDDGLLWLPRRDMLASLGGVAAGLVGYQGLSSAALAVDAPVEQCSRAENVNDKILDCSDPNRDFPCPPQLRLPVVDFKPEGKVKRVRQAVHLLSRENQEKYKEAIAKMKALPASNPLSFQAQAAIHEAYCDHHYRYDPTNKEAPFDVHFSWIFAPWHRMYIYFYEKALGQLIGDDTFALPFWNWDTPAGMVVPALFKDPFANPLYDRNRNPEHLDALVHLDLKDKNAPIPFNGPHDKAYEDAVYKNLCTIHQQQIRGGRCARSFLGEKFCTEMKQGDAGNQGSLERMAHTALHVWVGKQKPATGCTLADGVQGHDGVFCVNDMGFLGSAGRDPLFYSHHSNVDRMWHLWSTKLGGEGFKDPEWLDATFVFYDNYEKPQPVRIKFRDVLDTRNLGYTYDPEAEKDLPWVACKLTSLVPHGKDSAAPRPSASKALAYPLTVRKGEVVEVPAVAVPARKDGKPRVLVIQGIEYDPMTDHKFDVAINVPKGSALEVGPQNKEYAGSFAVVPSSKAGGGKLKGGITLSIDDVLEDCEAAGESTVDVVIVGRSEGEIKINVPPKILS